MVQVAQLRALRAVLDTGSFAAAGERVGLTGSAVSQQISSLERALGVPLFDRHPHAVRATAAAITLGIRADNALSQIDLLQREARALAAGTRGTIRIGSFPTASARLLPGMLARLQRRRTGIDVVLDEAEADELLARVEQGSVDLALVYSYDALPMSWPSDIVRTQLIHEKLLLLAPASGAALRPDLVDAAESSWIASRERTAGARSLETLCNQAGFSPRVIYRSNDYAVVRGLVAAGLGTAVIPALAHSPNAAVLTAPLSLVGAERTVFLVYRSNDASPLLAAVVRAFGESARSAVADLGGFARAATHRR